MASHLLGILLVVINMCTKFEVSSFMTPAKDEKEVVGHQNR